MVRALHRIFVQQRRLPYADADASRAVTDGALFGPIRPYEGESADPADRREPAALVPDGRKMATGRRPTRLTGRWGENRITAPTARSPQQVDAA